MAARQQLTHDWWNHKRQEFEVVVSEVVQSEAGKGDPELARLRLELLESFPTLATTEVAHDLATFLVSSASLPAKAQADGLHIAVAAVHGVEYLLTWNSRHIANAKLRPRVEELCRVRGFEPPVLCMPDELMGDRGMGKKRPDDEVWVDPIVEEVRRNREQLLAECDYDLGKLIARVRADGAAAGRETVSFPPRPSRKGAA